MQTFKNTSKIVITILFLTFGAYNCSDTSNGSDPDLSELSENEQKMLGTWKHIRTEGEGIYAGPTEGTFTWTFKANREATYLQKPKGMDGTTRDVTWRLDKNNNIIFDNDSIYRVEEFGEKQMRWYNYTMAELNNAHIYVVERQ